MEQMTKIKELILLRTQLIHDNSKKIAEMFKTDGITFASFQEVVNNVKVSIPANDPNAEFLNKTNNIFEVVYKSCVEFAEMNGSQFIPIEYIEIVVKQSISGLNEGMKEPDIAKDMAEKMLSDYSATENP